MAAAVFGAVEQWAGAGHPALVAALGGMSAPWLVLPFLVGATGKAVPFDYHARDGDGMVLAPDGRTLYLITDGYGYDGDPQPYLIVVSTTTGKRVGQPLALPDAPMDQAITPDGRTCTSRAATQSSESRSRWRPEVRLRSRPLSSAGWGISPRTPSLSHRTAGTSMSMAMTASSSSALTGRLSDAPRGGRC